MSGIILPVGRGLLVVITGALVGTMAVWHPWPLSLRLLLLVAFGLATGQVMRMRWRDVRLLA